MNARANVAAALLSLPGMVDVGGGFELRPRRAERHTEQTPEQRERAIARAEAKRARKRAKRLEASRG